MDISSGDHWSQESASKGSYECKISTLPDLQLKHKKWINLNIIPINCNFKLHWPLVRKFSSRIYRYTFLLCVFSWNDICKGQFYPERTWIKSQILITSCKIQLFNDVTYRTMSKHVWCKNRCIAQSPQECGRKFWNAYLQLHKKCKGNSTTDYVSHSEVIYETRNLLSWLIRQRDLCFSVLWTTFLSTV